MKLSTLESKMEVVAQKIASSSIYYLILIWLLRVFLFLLWIGKCLLIWLLRLSFSLLRECTRRYLSVALVAFTLTPQPTTPETTEPTLATRSLEWVEEERVNTPVEDLPTSPLLPMVLHDRAQISEDYLAIKDRERLLYEFEKIVAPQVSAFQLGEITVPVSDTRQLATFLKLKLSQTCELQSGSEAISAAVCGAILEMGSEGGVSKCVESSWERSHRGYINHALVYIAASLQDGKIHLVLVGRKVEEFLGSSEFRSRFNPPRTRGDRREWNSWTQAHLRSLRESAVLTAEELLSLGPVHAQVW